MCGRVVAARPRDYLAGHFQAEAVAGPELPASYNVAPGAPLHVVAQSRAGRRLGTMGWGLVPPWATSPHEGPRPINARAETLLERPAFADAVAHGRTCLVPCDGFYEWNSGPEGKSPFFLSAADGEPLALAGLWSRWSGPDAEPIVTFTVVTTAANADVAPLHDRMPVLLPRASWAAWLDRGTQVAGRLRLLAPAPVGSLVATKANRRVNNARNDGPELLSA